MNDNNNNFIILYKSKISQMKTIDLAKLLKILKLQFFCKL